MKTELLIGIIGQATPLMFIAYYVIKDWKSLVREF